MIHAGLGTSNGRGTSVTAIGSSRGEVPNEERARPRRAGIRAGSVLLLPPGQRLAASVLGTRAHPLAIGSTGRLSIQDRAKPVPFLRAARYEVT